MCVCIDICICILINIIYRYSRLCIFLTLSLDLYCYTALSAVMCTYTVYTIHYTVHYAVTVQCTVCSVQLYNVRVHCTLYSHDILSSYFHF